VDIWVIYEKADFTKYGEKPTFRVLENFGIIKLDPNFTPNTHMSLKNHKIESIESYVSLGHTSYEGSFSSLEKVH
jgi:hypothetical protein